MTPKAEPGDWGKHLHSRESWSFKTTQLAAINNNNNDTQAFIVPIVKDYVCVKNTAPHILQTKDGKGKEALTQPFS